MEAISNKGCDLSQALLGKDKANPSPHKRSSCKEDPPFLATYTAKPNTAHALHKEPHRAAQNKARPVLHRARLISFETIKGLPSHLGPAFNCMVGLLLVEGLLCLLGGLLLIDLPQLRQPAKESFFTAGGFYKYGYQSLRSKAGLRKELSHLGGAIK